jgi:cholesterol transport system auxiliary component
MMRRKKAKGAGVFSLLKPSDRKRAGSLLLMRLNQLSAVVLLATSLVGCAALPGGGPPPLDTFDLSAPDTGASGRRRSAQILIAEPAALKMLDGQSIVITSGPRSIQFLKGAQWADRLPLVVQARLAEAFQSSGGFGGVGTPGEGLAIDYQVVADIRAFQVGVGGASQANVEIYVRLLDDRNGVVRASRVFRASAPVTGEGNAGYVRALDAAFGQVGAEIVSWTEARV